ncbi:hypothetical protein [Streptomyces sp. NPDC005438]|uniref:hypothetical protein n=1 Tax=Streptomyces sp. NPDC005438 TaxID=3156880 RepID=UPI0033AAC5AB
MLTYLATALPRFCSPAARLLALQCALRTNGRGEVHLPHGLLRGMRLHQRADLWDELEYAHWLHRGAGPFMRACLLDAAMRAQPDRPRRARAAHWALPPLPRPASAALPSAVQLTALTVAAHTRPDGAGSADMDLLTHLCAQTPQQLTDLLDELTGSRLLSSWRRAPQETEVVWHLLCPR